MTPQVHHAAPRDVVASRMGRVLSIALLLLVGCRNGEPGGNAPKDAARPRRNIERPATSVHPLPPHAIHARVIGPYRLGDSVANVLAALPSGPRVAVLDVRGVVRLSVIRAEGGKITIGGPPLEPTSFISVLGPEVARTERGNQVGSAVDAIVDELGPRLRPPGVVADPRLVTVRGVGGRIYAEGGKVAAIIVADLKANSAATEPGPACAELNPEVDRVVGGQGAVLAGCTDTGQVVTLGEDVIWLSGNERLRRTATAAVPGLLFAGVARAGGRVETLALRQHRTGNTREWFLVTLRVDEGRVVRGNDELLYRLTDEHAGWMGSSLADLDLALEVMASLDGLQVRGFLIRRGGGVIRDVVPLLPRQIQRRRRAPTPAETGTR